MLCVVVFLFSNELIVVHHIVRTIICHASSRFILLLEMSKLESNADFHREVERRFKLTAVRIGVNPREMCVSLCVCGGG